MMGDRAKTTTKDQGFYQAAMHSDGNTPQEEGKQNPSTEFLKGMYVPQQRFKDRVQKMHPEIVADLQAKESSLSRHDKRQGVSVGEKDGGVYYDYTQVINRMLAKLIPLYEEKRFADGSKPSLADIATHIDDYMWFAKQVNHNTALDVKTDAGWQETFKGVRMPAYGDGENEKFLYQGQLMTREELGNMLYGYLGSVLGINIEMLQIMGGVAAEFDFSKDGKKEFLEALAKALPEKSTVKEKSSEGKLLVYGDDPNDQRWVKQGVDQFYLKEGR